MRGALTLAVFALSVQLAMAQGETTSAIVGQVADQTGGSISGATVTITGADDSIQPSQLLDLQKEFPFVEWGILLSRNLLTADIIVL